MTIAPEELRNAGASEDWLAAWNNFAKSAPDGDPEFLRPEFVRETCEYLRMGEDAAQALLAAAFAKNAEVARLLLYCRNCLLSENLNLRATTWPRLPELKVPNAPLLGAMVAVSLVPEIRKRYEAKGVPPEIVRDTLDDFEVRMHAFKKAKGVFGYDIHNWLMHFLKPSIFKLGRLQFDMAFFSQPFRAFRRKRDGAVVLLAENGQPFRANGLWNRNDDEPDLTGGWISAYKETENVCNGNPVTSQGRTLPQRVRLAKSEWACVLQKGDPILGVHIQAKGRMEHDLCGESFAQAPPFFDKYFPELKWKAFTCDSWLLDPQFDGLLAEDSNIVRFLREWYLHPVPGSQGGILQAVFGKKDVDFTTEPLDNSLKRAVVNHIRQGHHWQGGGGVILRDDLNWGTRTYRQRQLPF